ncbi:MAG: hypothetical protein CL627_07895 [Aurantimonas sp.]|nr:hypothetical protein [Aurantimonas sp.]
MNLYEIHLAHATSNDMLPPLSADDTSARQTTFAAMFSSPGSDDYGVGKRAYYVLAESAGEAEKRVVDAYAASGIKKRVVVGSVNMLASTSDDLSDSAKTLLLYEGSPEPVDLVKRHEERDVDPNDLVESLRQ